MNEKQEYSAKVMVGCIIGIFIVVILRLIQLGLAACIN